MNPARHILATTALAAVTLWAFTGNTGPTQGEANLRADPADVYNPVLAGERLPSGFRQLLPRDAIAPVYDPTFVPAGAVTWTPEAQVIGVAMGSEAKAYPVSFLNGREMVVDEFDGIPILVTW